eukprot:jgi/Botrbrau1/12628/Bobra.0169s0153.1
MWTPRAGTACSIARHGVLPVTRADLVASPLAIAQRNLRIAYFSTSRKSRDGESVGGSSLPPLVAGACGVLAILQARHIYRERGRQSQQDFNRPVDELQMGQCWGRDISIRWRSSQPSSSGPAAHPRDR